MFPSHDRRGEYEEFVNWPREGGAQHVADYYTNKRPITDEEKKLLFGRAPRTNALEELIKDSRHPTIKKLEDRFQDEAEPFSKDWVGIMSKSQLITWVEANFKGHAPDQEIEDWLKEKAIPWKNGDLTRRVETANEGRPRVYLLKDRPKEMGDGSYLDWTEGELGHAPDTGTIALSNIAGPMKWKEGDQKDPTKRAYNLARQVESTPKEVFNMVVSYKKLQDKALKQLDKLDKENPELLDAKIPVGTRITEKVVDGDYATETIYDTKRNQIRKEITEAFIKEYASVFIHERPSSDYTGDNRGPEYLGKKKPPNVEIYVKDNELHWEIHSKTRELIKHGNKEIDL